MGRILFLLFFTALPVIKYVGPGTHYNSNVWEIGLHDSVLSFPLSHSIPDELKPVFEINLSSIGRKRNTSQNALFEFSILAGEFQRITADYFRKLAEENPLYLIIRVFRI